MITKTCPKCGKPLLKVSEGKIAQVEEGQSVREARPGIEWETYTCQTKNCAYYNKTLVWDSLKNMWKKLPKTN
ncbi:hypothetical protein HXY32_04445 [Candidatus Bathyarchaeota archaeon]|nr:hypothetical protein [Candidatus Bathyarchaeota archaeon]